MIKWTIDKIKEEALKYTSKMGWKKSCNSYAAAQRHGIIDECCTHMIPIIKPKHYWTNEQIKKEALKYKTRVEWFNKNRSSYSIASKRGLLNDFCKHMTTNNRGKFIIYVFEFPDNHYYVGLTRRRDERLKEHYTDSKSSVFKHIIKTNSYPIYKVIWEETVYEHIAQKKENQWDNYYLKNNWFRLNKTSTGSLGSIKHKKWSTNKIKKEALNYKTKKEWYTFSPKSYDAAQRYNMIDECCKHMSNTKKPKGYWTIDNIKKEALKYTSKMEWKKNSSSYSKACKLDILNDCCNHML